MRYYLLWLSILSLLPHSSFLPLSRAAEARNRIRIMRLRYQANKAQEINHLISCQPSALKAVRLQALVPAKSDLTEKDDSLEKLAVSVSDSAIILQRLGRKRCYILLALFSTYVCLILPTVQSLLDFTVITLRTRILNTALILTTAQMLPSALPESSQ